MGPKFLKMKITCQKLIQRYASYSRRNNSILPSSEEIEPSIWDPTIGSKLERLALEAFSFDIAPEIEDRSIKSGSGFGKSAHFVPRDKVRE